MNTQHMTISLDQLKPNPWQTRTDLDAAHIARLAEDIRSNGLLQVPLARPNHTGYELAFGHNRLAAYKLLADQQSLNEFTQMPVDVRELTDRQMSDFAASENAQRKNLSAIETAQAIMRRINDFNLTQLEAAKPFGYTSQGAVSNLLRLLGLPLAAQAFVHEGKLAERHARELLVVSQIAPTRAEEIAREVVKVEDAADRDEEIEAQIETALKELGRDLAYKSWDDAFPGKPISADIDGGPAQIVRCADCRHNNKFAYSNYCLRPACFLAKTEMWIAKELKRASQDTNIPLAAPGEKTTLVYAGGWNEGRELCEAILKGSKRHSSLRLVRYDKPGAGAHWDRKDKFGTPHAALATTDETALRASLKLAPKTSEPKKTAAEVDAERKAEAVAKKTDDERIERLLKNAVPALCANQPIHPALLEMIQSALAWSPVEDAKQYFSKEDQVVIATLFYADLDTGALIGSDDVEQKIIKLAKALRVNLPKGWNVEPDAAATASKKTSKHK